MFEFKYAKLTDLGKTGEELRRMEDEELEQIDLVVDLFGQARGQLLRYRDALTNRYGDELRIRAYAVVALGFERLVARELTG